MTRRRAILAAYPGLEETGRLSPSEEDFVPAWPCSRRGLPGRPHYCERRWSLTPPFHRDSLAKAVCFCGPFRQVTSCDVSPPRMLSDSAPDGVRTFLDGVKRHRDCPTSLRLFHHTRRHTQRQPYRRKLGISERLYRNRSIPEFGLREFHDCFEDSNKRH